MQEDNFVKLIAVVLYLHLIHKQGNLPDLGLVAMVNVDYVKVGVHNSDP